MYDKVNFETRSADKVERFSRLAGKKNHQRSNWEMRLMLKVGFCRFNPMIILVRTSQFVPGNEDMLPAPITEPEDRTIIEAAINPLTNYAPEELEQLQRLAPPRDLQKNEKLRCLFLHYFFSLLNLFRFYLQFQ